VGKTNSVFSRLNFRSVPDLNLQPNHSPNSSPCHPNQPNLPPCSSPRRPNHGGSFLSRDAVNSNRPAFNSNRVAPGGPHFLSGANAVPLGNRHSKPKPTQRPGCSRCLSNFHTRPNYHSSTRCTACFRLGHVAFSCRFPHRFPGLSKDGVFSTQIRSVAWDPLFTATWFKSMTSGASPSTPPVLTHVSSTSIPWCLPSSAFLSSAQSPSASPADSGQDVLPESRVVLELRPPSPLLAQHSPPPQSPHPSSEPPEPELQSQQENLATVGSNPPPMAYQFVDPAPFIPRGFQRVVVPNRKAMRRSSVVGPLSAILMLPFSPSIRSLSIR
jgi:hypothetical protein